MPRAKTNSMMDPNTVVVDSTGERELPPPQGAPTEEVPDAIPTLNPEKLKALGQHLRNDFDQYEKDRRPLEQKWAQALRQFLGEYDPKVKEIIGKDRSLAYPRLTRVKCISMLSRLMNLLFPSDEKNWTIAPSPVPNLSPEDLQTVLDKMQEEQKELTDESITEEVVEFARARAANLETEIEDQLTELGGSAQLSYVSLARKVLMSGLLYGVGVLKGPFMTTRMQTRWSLQASEDGAQKITPEQVEIRVPQYDFAPVWDHYFDMSAKYLHQMDGTFQRVVMSRQQLRALAKDPLFLADVIEKWMKDNQSGNYKERQYESELRAISTSDPTNSSIRNSRKYECVVWDGMLSGHYLQGCGVAIKDSQLHEMIECSVWMLGDFVIRCNLSPWVILEESERIRTYHYFMFEEDDSSLIGNGLPSIMRDSQLGVCAAVRMILDNASIVCGPSVEVNRALLSPGQDTQGIHAYQVWWRDEDETSATANLPAVRSIVYESHITELEKIATLFRGFADQETFVNPATGGDMQAGPSEPFRTAAGASLLTGLAALPFKDVVRNFDVFTESFMRSLIAFNKHFNKKESISGDFQAVARGATSLIAKEVRGIAIDELARSLTPGEMLYIDWKGMLKERLRSRDIPVHTVMCSDAEATQREQAQQEQQKQQSDQMNRLMHAETRKVLADAVKALTQSDKNTTAAQAVVYTAIAKGIENGISPQTVAETRAGAGVSANLVRQPGAPSGGGNGTASGGGSDPRTEEAA